MLCQFLLYSKMNQLYIYIYPVFFGLPSHLGHHRALNRVPCAIEQVLISCLFFFNLFILFILFLAALGLCCCARAFLQLRQAWATLCCSSRASHCGGFSCCGARALEPRLSSCGARAQLLHGMWDLPGLGLEPVRVPCIGRQILNHCTTRKALDVYFKPSFFIVFHDAI